MTELLCSVADVRARVDTDLSDPELTDVIEEVSDEIEEYVGEWLAPRTDTTLLFDVEWSGRSLTLMSGGRRVPVRALTALALATTSQPDTGGTYTATTAYVLRPRPTADSAASRIVLTGSSGFTAGWSIAQATGSFGPAAVAPRVRAVAIALVRLSLNVDPGAITERIGEWSESRAGQRSERDDILSRLGAMPVFG